MTPDDFMNEVNAHYAALQEEARKIRLERLRTLFGGTNVDIDDILRKHGLGDQVGSGAQQGIGGQTLGGTPPPQGQKAPKWTSIDQMMRDLDRKRKEQAARPKPPVVNKETRIQAIEDELDIIRGRKPTPKGYKVDPSKIKALMTELKELKAQ